MGTRQEVVFRKWFFSAFALTAAAGVFAGFIAICVAAPQPGDYAGALIMLAFWYWFWLLGWESAVRVTPSGVIVDNLVFREVIPWRDFAGFDAPGGLRIRMVNGDSVGSIMYGGSVLGAILGYRWTRRQAQLMNDAAGLLSALQADSPADEAVERRSRIHVNPWPPLVTLAVFEVVALLANVL